MKRGFLSLLALALVLCALCITAPNAKAAEAHTHCVCGGSAQGIGDHVCGQESWQSLTTALAKKGMTPNKADFGKLSSGCYYLDQDIVVTGNSNLTKNISICLNGHTITSADIKVFGYLKADVMNICDCSGTRAADGSWSWNGHIYGGADPDRIGSVIYTHAGTRLNLFGGNIHSAEGAKGGAICTAHDGCGDLNGDGKTDSEDKNMAPTATFHFYNGNIIGARTSSYYTVSALHSSQHYWYGGQIQGGYNKSGNPEMAVILSGNALHYPPCTSVSDAVKAVTGEEQYVKLLRDSEQELTISTSCLLDLNGHKLSNVIIDAQVTVIDTAGGGLLNCTVTDQGSLPRDFTVNVPGKGQQNYQAAETDQGLSFYVMDMQMTRLSIDPAKAGIGYVGMFHVSPYLASQVKSYGMQLWLDGYDIHTYTATKALAYNTTLTLRLKNILKQDNSFADNYYNADTQVNARLFLKLQDGTMMTTETYSFDLRQMLEAADPYFASLTKTQKSNLRNMYATYETLMMGWDMPNLIHESGWTQVDAAGFQAILTDSGRTYELNSVQVPYSYIKAGKYILTEDIDLSSTTIDQETGEEVRNTPTMHVKSGERVSICLNGHTLRSDSRLFRVYGQLDICDCTTHEGSLTSSFSGSNSAYAPIAYIYSGTMNIYGGHVSATGTVSSGGVLSVGKSGDTSGALNIYGGEISGGKVTSNSGLIALYNKATLTMYDGQLHDGYAGNHSGAISVGSSASCYLYGGEIYNSYTDGNGGGIHISSGNNQVYLGEHLTIRDNTAGLSGGNIYNESGCHIAIDGATITGGQATQGGGIYNAGSTVILTGDTTITQNSSGNLSVTGTSQVDATGLTQNAHVEVCNQHTMSLANIAGYEKLTWEGQYVSAIIGGQPVLIPASFSIPTEVEGFQVGHGRADITPTELGMPLAGYSNASERLSQVIDETSPLTVTTVAITDEAGQTVLIMSADLIRPAADLTAALLPAISAATGVPESNIFLTFTHTHSAPETKSTSDPTIVRYRAMLPDRFAESANKAMADRAPATMEMGSFEVSDPSTGKWLNFTRHYYYFEEVNYFAGEYGYNKKTGQYELGYGYCNYIKKYAGDNFGVKPSDTTRLNHVTEADHTMHLVKFVRDGKDILLANWRVHPHLTGGGTRYMVSADIIGTTQAYFEANTDCHFIYVQGASGNINEVTSITAESHGYTKNQHVAYGQALGTAIINKLSRNDLTPAETGLWQVDNYNYTGITDISTDEEYAHAKAAKAAYEEQEAAGLSSSKLKTWLEENWGYVSHYHFNNVINRHSMNETYDVPLNTFALGNTLAFYTAPGELWDTISQEMEADSPYPMNICVGYCQSHYNYFVYDPENGGAMTYESYESNNYRFVAPQTVNDFLAYWKASLNRMYENSTQ